MPPYIADFCYPPCSENATVARLRTSARGNSVIPCSEMYDLLVSKRESEVDRQEEQGGKESLIVAKEEFG